MFLLGSSVCVCLCPPYANMHLCYNHTYNGAMFTGLWRYIVHEVSIKNETSCKLMHLCMLAAYRPLRALYSLPDVPYFPHAACTFLIWYQYSIELANVGLTMCMIVACCAVVLPLFNQVYSSHSKSLLAYLIPC